MFSWYNSYIKKIAQMFKSHKNYMQLLIIGVALKYTDELSGRNWTHFAQRPQCTVTLNLNFAILKRMKNKI